MQAILFIGPESRAMALIVKMFAIIFLSLAAGLAIVSVYRKSHPFKNAAMVIVCAMVVGVVLLFFDRITEISNPWLGTIKTASVQASNDAATINALKKRVEDQSATVDAVAAQAQKAQKLSLAAQAQTKTAQERLVALNKVVSDATTALDKLKAKEHIVELITAAENDDRAAYDTLQQIGAEKNGPFRSLAENAWQTIFNERSGPLFYTPSPVPWRPGLDPAWLSFSQLEDIYHTVAPAYKVAFLYYIFQRKDIAKIKKMTFFLRVMETDPSLNAMQYAGYYFSQEAKLHIDAMALPYFVKWWHQHKGELETKEVPNSSASVGKDARPAK